MKYFILLIEDFVILETTNIWYLDPCLKNRFFNGAEQQARAKEMMLEEVRKLTGRPVIEVQESESGDDSDECHEIEPASKRINRRTEATELQKSFEEILGIFGGQWSYKCC